VFTLLIAVRFAAPIVSLSPGPFKKGEARFVGNIGLRRIRQTQVKSALVAIRQTQGPGSQVAEQAFECHGAAAHILAVDFPLFKPRRLA
jgi:hypothetical protein